MPFGMVRLNILFSPALVSILIVLPFAFSFFERAQAQFPCQAQATNYFANFYSASQYTSIANYITPTFTLKVPGPQGIIPFAGIFTGESAVLGSLQKKYNLMRQISIETLQSFYYGSSYISISNEEYQVVANNRYFKIQVAHAINFTK